MKKLTAYCIMLGLGFTTVLFGYKWKKEKLYDHWSAKYLQPKSKIALKIDENVNFKSNVQITPEGRYTGDIELEAPASVMGIQTPEGTITRPPRPTSPALRRDEGYIEEISERVADKIRDDQRKIIEGIRRRTIQHSGRPPQAGSGPIVSGGKYQVLTATYDGGTDPLCWNENPGWIELDVDAAERITIPCKGHLSAEEARRLTQSLKGSTIEVLKQPEKGDRYKDKEGNPWVVVRFRDFEFDETYKP